MTYSALWLVWILGFLAIEITALTNSQRGDTLSEKVWIYVTQPKWRTKDDNITWLVWGGRAGVAILLIWLFIHFIWGY